MEPDVSPFEGFSEFTAEDVAAAFDPGSLTWTVALFFCLGIERHYLALYPEAPRSAEAKGMVQTVRPGVSGKQFGLFDRDSARIAKAAETEQWVTAATSGTNYKLIAKATMQAAPEDWDDLLALASEHIRPGSGFSV